MRSNGFALVATLMVVMAVGIVTAGSLILSVTNLRVTKNDATVTQALAVAQAASSFWRAELVSLYAYMVENFDLYEDDIAEYIANGGQITCGNYLAIGVDTDRDGEPDVRQGETLPALAVPFESGPAGSTAVAFATRGAAVVLDARGSAAGARARVVDEFSVSTVDIWNNAVFAGDSAANATIQGRAEIRGSVHVLGEGLTSSDMALDVSGAFALGNTYRKLNSSLGVNATEMRLTTPDPEDLCATLRVRSGYVQMGGSAQIGHAESANPDPFMDNMRGIYTNHGIFGGTLNETVFSANGMTAAYDAGDSFHFPRLDEINPATQATWRHGLASNALRLSLDPSLDDRNLLPQRDGASHGQPYLTAGCFDAVNGLFGVSPSGTLTRSTKKDNGTGTPATGFALEHGATPSFSCAKRVRNDFGGDLTVTEVIWDLGANELYLGGAGGVVNFRGANLLITGSGSSGTEIAYRGEGILFAEDLYGSAGGSGGQIDLEVDFLPAAGPAASMDPVTKAYLGDAAVTNSYPATAIVALVADRSVVSLGAQKRFTTAIYAEDSVDVTKQTLVAGSIVTRTFDAGSQVPTVLYVPNLAERLSDLMPGTGSKIYAVSNVAFSRR